MLLLFKFKISYIAFQYYLKIVPFIIYLIFMIVVGAGPAGIGTVGVLLQNGYTNITWIDPKFLNGEFEFFKSIPANTRAVNLAKFAKFLTVFSKYDHIPELKVNVFEKYDQNVQCNLDDINLCLSRMTQIIRTKYNQQVKMIQDKVETLIQNDESLIVITKGGIIQGKKVFLCLGANPKKMEIKPQIQRLNLYHMMSPVLIQNYNLTDQIVQIYGSSHSALLAIRNLVHMKNPPKKIIHFMNKKLVFAQYEGSFIKHNYTGLKGVTKQFGLRYDKGEFSSIVQTRYSPTPCQSTKIIEAIGFTGRSIKFVPKNQVETDNFEMINGKLICEGREIKNVYLVGLMSPQQVTDKYGEKMLAVNVYIFCEHVSEVIKGFTSNLDKI